MLPLTPLNNALRAVMLEGLSLTSQWAEVLNLSRLGSRHLRAGPAVVPLELKMTPSGKKEGERRKKRKREKILTNEDTRAIRHFSLSTPALPTAGFAATLSAEASLIRVFSNVGFCKESRDRGLPLGQSPNAKAECPDERIDVWNPSNRLRRLFLESSYGGGATASRRWLGSFFALFSRKRPPLAPATRSGGETVYWPD